MSDVKESQIYSDSKLFKLLQNLLSYHIFNTLVEKWKSEKNDVNGAESWKMTGIKLAQV